MRRNRASFRALYGADRRFCLLPNQRRQAQTGRRVADREPLAMHAIEILARGIVQLALAGNAIQGSGLKGQSYDLLNPVRRQEGIAEDFFGLLADAIHAAGTLDEPDDRPG